MCMCCSGEFRFQTLGGAIATATHGTGLRFGSISAQVIGLQLVLASGALLNLSDTRDDQKELMAAARLVEPR